MQPLPGLGHEQLEDRLVDAMPPAQRLDLGHGDAELAKVVRVAHRLVRVIGAGLDGHHHLAATAKIARQRHLHRNVMAAGGGHFSLGERPVLARDAYGDGIPPLRPERADHEAHAHGSPGAHHGHLHLAPLGRPAVESPAELLRSVEALGELRPCSSRRSQSPTERLARPNQVLSTGNGK